MVMSQENGNSKDPGIKTDDKKQHFDDIYIQKDPVPFKERIIDTLDYISDDFNRETFDRLILPWCKEQGTSGGTLNYVDLCSCFGNTTMAVVNGMNVEEIRENWRNQEACQKVSKPRRFSTKITGIDISENALAYGINAGIFDEIIEADLNSPTSQQKEAVVKTMKEADVVISTASLVYLDIPAIESLIQSFAKGTGEGYLLANFLNPFALDKADATKRILMENLEFVGSQASRHRRMSEIEQENYPEEEWALLEIWVLRRR